MTINAIVFDAYGTLYDVQSVTGAIGQAFPGHTEYVTQVWRLKQLEYTWLRTLMGDYQDFRAITRDALSYSLDTLGVAVDAARLDQVTDAYNALSLYPESSDALAELAEYRLAILSNGSPDMLEALVRGSGLRHAFEAVISVDAARAYKPDPRAYELVRTHLGVPPQEVAFVSSNGFDIAGARRFGFNVVRIERVTPTALREDLTSGAPIGPSPLYRALRTQTEALGFEAHVVIPSLRELPSCLAALTG